MSLYRELQKGMAKSLETDGAWLICEPAIVTDVNDPDRQHRIKVLLTGIDEDEQFDDWVRPASQVCLGEGFGAVFLPEKGQEVFVTGILGQKFNLVYHGAVYNESMAIPQELGPEVAGIKVPKGLQFIAGEVAKILANEIEVRAEQLAKLKGQTVRVESGQEIQIEAGTACKINGASFEVMSNGNLKIQGGNVQITGTSIKLFNRTVAPTGPTI